MTNLYQSIWGRTETDFRRFFLQSPFKSFMFVLMTLLAIVMLATGARRLAKFWDIISFQERFDMCLMLIVATFPWLGVVRQHRRLRELVRREPVSEKILREAAYTSINALVAAYAALDLALAALSIAFHNQKG